MTKRDVFSISLKILGVYSVMLAVMRMPDFAIGIGTIFQAGQDLFWNRFWLLGITTTSFILFLVVAYVLLRWGDLIAERLVRKDSEIHILGVKEWERPVFVISLRIIGVVCLIRAFRELIHFILDLIFLVEKYQRVIRTTTWIGVASNIMLLIIGGYLILGGKHLVEFVFREPKTTPSSDNSE